MVLRQQKGSEGIEFLQDVLDFSQELFIAACEAFDRYGKGRHKAALNFGDCMSYAVAKARAVPLLYKGQDFLHTDINPALP
jgi:ribonuclease VapC